MNALTYWFAYGGFYRRGIERKYGNAVARYVVDHGYTVRKAQKRVKMDTTEEVRKREDERREFTATVDCPKCGVWAIHWLQRKGFRSVTRQCRNPECGYEWRQA